MNTNTSIFGTAHQKTQSHTAPKHQPHSTTQAQETSSTSWTHTYRSDLSDIPSSSSAKPPATQPPLPPPPPPNPPTILPQKRRATGDINPSSITLPPVDSLNKRRRIFAHSRHTLNRFDYPQSQPQPQPQPQPTSAPALPTPEKRHEEPPSPLFFSNNSRRLRPQLPARFSSSEAGARMLSKAHGEESAIKTVSLPRGTFSSSSPPGLTSLPSGRGSAERASITGVSSPDPGERTDSLRALGQVGIIELLEHDGRPTFVVDLAETTNYNASDSLRVVYSNAALRSQPELYESLTGQPPSGGSTSRTSSNSPLSYRVERPPHLNPSARSSNSRDFGQFKAWLLSSAVQGESLEICLPSYIYAGLSWSCSTLRRRLRVISASTFNTRSPLTSSNSPTVTSTKSAVEAESANVTGDSQVVPTIEGEPLDYFGDAAPPPPGPAPTSHPISNPPKSGNITNYPSTPNENQNSIFNANSDLATTLSSYPSLSNECVLGAATAGNYDAFSNPASVNHEVGFFDWTRLPLSDSLPPHIHFALSIDWTSTALGPIETWSSDLRQMCNLIMASPHPAAMYWGEDLVAIYNEAYILLAGQKHPTLMGQSYRHAWSEIWDDVKGVFDNAKTTGQATMKDDDCLFIKRSNYLEETYFSWSIIPMVGGDGTVTGLYNPAFEKTRRKVAERRMLTLREVGERTATARDVKGFWEQVGYALATNDFDTPFVLLYSVGDSNESDSSSMHSSSLVGERQCFLEGSLGVPNGHPCAPRQIDLKEGMEGFGPVFREVHKLGKPVVLDVADGSTAQFSGHVRSGNTSPTRGLEGEVPGQMLEGVEWRGFGDPCRSIVVCPVQPTTGETTLGFLVLGVNPRRPYDDDYSLFVQLLSRQLATSLASVVLFEEEIRRGQKAAKLAALDRIELSQQLAARTQEARDSETRFTRMADFSPAGLFIADSSGHISYCNDTWYLITRVPKNPDSTDRWIDAVKEEDQALVKNLWDDLVNKVKPVTAEFRFKAQWDDRNGNKNDTWVLFSAYPEKYTEDTLVLGGKYAEGNLKSVFGSITNISAQKWAENFQKRKVEEAVELKRQQENFIDITSHEMRNPLSAILQCADEISSSLTEFRMLKKDTIDPELVTSNIDAAQTIALCANHQKRIVDDVLTLSKLDSAMLMVTPVDVQPLTVVQRALKMFEGEVQTAGIQMRFIVDDSFKKLGIDWVRIDPSRVLQVLINLTTNAIKFTTTEDRRTINVTIAASQQRPSLNPNRPVDYFPTRSKRLDMTRGPDWGDGEEVYVQFAVQDTGRGLTTEEKKMLFLRFSQASPRTHVQYGGSGLGLFISRELTELQGGEIGVASEAGKGSTFAFYVKAKRSQAPSDPHMHIPLPPLRSSGDDRLGKRGEILTTKTRDFAPAPSSSSAQVADNKNKGQGISVLIVEDNLVNQRVLQKQLKNLGFTTHVANHGGEALDRLRQSTYWHENTTTTASNKPKPPSTPTVPSSSAPAAAAASSPLRLDVVLMDQEMPVMDGLACTRRIREMEQQGLLVSHVPIIAVTANARAEQIEALIAAGMDDVVSKPFRIAELTPKIIELSGWGLGMMEHGGRKVEEVEVASVALKGRGKKG
ncbi:hypothetical protein K402DRAFT_419437 [Aulographum hederae CBS 113979]|uniref:Uncharacterized protein n=1 Tax=Aulographum hederae CBS 113979 TaxID=1176131 RepID=A0A6G1H631_9PEZI|nr:hypothetical protein K402DRAFT_419437 [Aulographum hederae CBS 113979]